MKGKMKIGLVLILAVLLTTTIVFAYSWFMMRPIGLTGNILATNGLQVYSDAACTIPLTSLNLGTSIHHGDVVEALPTAGMYVKNTGEQTIQTAWNITGLPTGITYTLHSEGSAPNIFCTENQLNPLAPGAVAHLDSLVFTFTSSAPLGSFTAQLDWYGQI
jgi:hypothetical protein